MDRQHFLSYLAGMAFIPQTINRRDMTDGRTTRRSGRVAGEPIDWEEVHADFYLDGQTLDFRTFAASPVPSVTINRFIDNYRDVQSLPSVRNHGIAAGSKALLRVKIAEQLNCSHEEVAIMRNTTEALNNALSGVQLERGDEVLASVHEYDSMVATLKQRQAREGIVLKYVDIPYQPASKEEILALYKRAVTEKTKLILISHIVWISGQIYPVAEICKWAREKGIITVVDAAQSFSHIETDVAKLDCDYFGASLHKWCAAPLGTGFLYVRKEKISSTYPLLASYQFAPDAPEIEKFENFGATSPVFDACVNSLDYWSHLGFTNKVERILFLKNYLADRLSTVKHVEIATNLGVEHSCGITYFRVENRSANEIKQRLYKDFQISVQAIENYKNAFVDYKNVNCVGVATPVFVLPAHIDRFVDSLSRVV